MAARYATRDPIAAVLHRIDEALAHDGRGYCTSECLPQHHGGRHAERAS